MGPKSQDCGSLLVSSDKVWETEERKAYGCQLLEGTVGLYTLGDQQLDTCCKAERMEQERVRLH